MSDEKTAKRRVTLRDVAQAAGVSLKTASNVINGSGRMTDETRAKVESVIKDLDYRVNVAARIGEKRTRVPLKPVEMGGEPWPESGVQEAGGLY